MKELVKGIPVFLCLAHAASGCAAGTGEVKDKKSLARLHELEKDLFGPDRAEEGYDRIVKEMEEKAKNLVYLEAGGKRHRAAAVYFCSSLTDRYRCQSVHADDTIHLTEFPDQYPAAVLDKESLQTVKLIRLDGAKDEFPEMYTGDPGLMHGSGYDEIRKIHAGKNGFMAIEVVNPHVPQVVFTIIRSSGESLFRKYVWVIDPG